MGALKSSHCSKGHPMAEPNLYMRGDGKRECLTCKRNRNRGGTANVERVGGTGAGYEGASNEGDEIGRHLNGLAVSFLRETKEPAERIRAVPTLRCQLVGRDGPDEKPPREAIAIGEDFEDGRGSGSSADPAKERFEL